MRSVPEEAGTILRNISEFFVLLYFRKGTCRAQDAGKIAFLGTIPGLAALAVAEYQFCDLEVRMKPRPISRIKKA